MKNSFKTATIITLLILVTIYTIVQVYDQFRLTRMFNYEGHQWCSEMINTISRDSDLYDKDGAHEAVGKAIENCREQFKKNFQLPIRKSDTSSAEITITN